MIRAFNGFLPSFRAALPQSEIRSVERDRSFGIPNGFKEGGLGRIPSDKPVPQELSKEEQDKQLEDLKSWQGIEELARSIAEKELQGYRKEIDEKQQKFLDRYGLTDEFKDLGVSVGKTGYVIYELSNNRIYKNKFTQIKEIYEKLLDTLRNEGLNPGFNQYEADRNQYEKLKASDKPTEKALQEAAELEKGIQKLETGNPKFKLDYKQVKDSTKSIERMDKVISEATNKISTILKEHPAEKHQAIWEDVDSYDQLENDYFEKLQEKTREAFDKIL